ncbi:MAG: hypothetical protein IT361_02760 [Gemmatimonadaceae bacterium]|nr:hypothetical protein [Gemmatimonadaceae bacterium]
MRSTLLTLVFLLPAACNSFISPTRESLLSVVGEQVTISSSAGHTVLVVPAVLANSLEEPISFSYCAIVLERETGERWEQVWAPICSLGTDTNVRVEPGRQLQFVVTASTATAPDPTRWGPATVDGTYRVRAFVARPGGSPPLLPWYRTVSQPFQVTH